MGNNYNKSFTPDSPCHGCTERKPGTGCHDRCERFGEWRNVVQKINKAEQAMNPDIMSEASKRELWRRNRYIRKNRGHGYRPE